MAIESSKNSRLDVFKGKTVVITGHTGFKGSWLSAWLVKLGANVIGISLYPPSNPNHFEILQLAGFVEDLRIDIRDSSKIRDIIISSKPDFIFHLAAQSLVSQSFENPVENWQTNVIGTLNILDGVRKLSNECSAVIITSDKCYKNKEQKYGYVEGDELGGIDPYSASKASAELAIHSYVGSFFNSKSSLIRLATARAGNVIGGGDWAKDRIVPDCVRSWSQGNSVNLRNPNSVRPWQHVLEPLSGYLALAMLLKSDSSLHGESFNFGPLSAEEHTVLELVNEMSIHWDKVTWETKGENEKKFHETNLLKLNCEKAFKKLQWNSVLNFHETIRMTTEWYKKYYSDSIDALVLTNMQIDSYTNIAKAKGLVWAQ